MGDTFPYGGGGRPNHSSKRQKLPLHEHHLHHQQADDHYSSPRHFNVLSNRQPLLLTPPTFSMPLLFNRPADDDRDSLSLSLFSSDHHPRCHSIGDPPVSYFDDDVPNVLWRSSVPLGPFTGYASILNRSSFLKPAQDLLDELCGFDSHLLVRRSYSDHVNNLDLIHSHHISTKACKEILLLDEVFKRYKQYYQHLQSVVASFEAVCGLGNAAPYISFALSAMAQQFCCLKKTLFQRAQIAGEETGNSSTRNVTLGCKETICENLKPNETSSAIQQPVWRSQRGLPAYAVAVFKNWLFEHFLHPYPSDTDKNLLAQQTGLSRNQVSNWFINARVRLWKPLVEEIHTLDEQQGQPALRNELRASKANVLHQPPDMQSADHQPRTVAMQMSLSKQYHDRFKQSCSESSVGDLSPLAVEHGKPGENMDISLALGLQQNNVSGTKMPTMM